MKKGLKASSLRIILVLLLVLMILGAGAGFYYGIQQVRSMVIEVNHTSADANASANSVDELRKLKQALADSETLVNKANQLFATDANYQTQALKDVQKYAAQAGLTIANTNFNLEAGDTPQVSDTEGGKAFSISLQTPLSYKKLLQFLDAIEGNLPKMQVVGIDVSRPDASDADKVITGDVKIVISTR